MGNCDAGKNCQFYHPKDGAQANARQQVEPEAEAPAPEPKAKAKAKAKNKAKAKPKPGFLAHAILGAGILLNPGTSFLSFLQELKLISRETASVT